ncbi:MAG: hypothetical protein H7099_09160 [Gemmatimonadaceae bacterium]|nr:hypothetical protein [Gemmatimonadaceae bacterium]
MQRALIAIGVKKTGGLPELQAALDGAQAMHDWARGHQKIPAARVKLITDEKSRVTRERLFDAVDTIAKLGYVEQLIVYFSGHGINSGLHEQWLLSRAPEDPGAAVNLRGSHELARYAGIGHVVFISDACRTAADTIQAQSVSGGEIFPNNRRQGQEKPVDQFFATLVGDPALEVKSVTDAASRYRAAYTTVLLDALHGRVPTLLEPQNGHAVVRPWPLKDHLGVAVPSFLSTLPMPGGITQQPDARVESRPDAWIAMVLDAPAAVPSPAPAAKPLTRATRAGRGRPASLDSTHPDTIFDLGEDDLPKPSVLRAAAGPSDLLRDASAQLQAALEPQGTRQSEKRRGATRSPTARESVLEHTLARTGVVFGPDHFETQCGIKVRGAALADTFSPHATVSIGHLGDVIQVGLEQGRAATNVFVKLADGSAVVVPALKDHITSLTIDDGRLRDVAFEPSLNTARGQALLARRGDNARLRNIIAAASSLGAFRVDAPAQGTALLEGLTRAGGLDPALSVYAAWALHDRRMRAEITKLHEQTAIELGVRIFDLAMLADTLADEQDAPATGLFPCVPFLTQGWSLLSAFDITLRGRLPELRAHLRPTLWTHITPAGAGILRDTLQSGLID